MNYSEWTLPFARSLKAEPALIEEILAEIEKLSQFRFQSVRYTSIPDFLNKEPYISFLKGTQQVLLCVCTLGPLIDRKIRQLECTDLHKAYLFDRCSGFVLEKLADEAQDELNLDLSLRFCPGYSGSPLSDVREIIERVHPSFVKLSELNIMTPSKSMAGFCGIGIHPQFSCENDCEDCPKEKKCS